MKRIGTLNGKPVVQCDENLLKKNTILYKENNGKIELSEREDSGKIDNITQGGIENNTESKTEYYRVYGDGNIVSIIDSIYLGHTKIVSILNNYITIEPSFRGYPDSSFYMEIEYLFPNTIINTRNSKNIKTNSLKENMIGLFEDETVANNFLSILKPITKEEFYNINLTTEEMNKNWQEVYELYQTMAG